MKVACPNGNSSSDWTSVSRWSLIASKNFSSSLPRNKHWNHGKQLTSLHHYSVVVVIIIITTTIITVLVCLSHQNYALHKLHFTSHITSLNNGKIYRVKFELLEAIYSCTGQSDIADIIMSRRSKFLAGLQCSQNVVIRHLVSTLL